MSLPFHFENFTWDNDDCMGENIVSLTFRIAIDHGSNIAPLESWLRLSTVTTKKQKPAFGQLSEQEGPIRRETKNHYYFCETIEQQIQQLALKVYPEILDKGPERMKDLKYMFVADIQNMFSRLSKFMDK